MTDQAIPVGDALRAAQLDVVIADLARDVVHEVVPEQSDYFELLLKDGTGTRRPWTGGTIGSGSELPVVADVIITLLTGTVAQVWGAATFARLQRRRGLRRRRSVETAQITIDVGGIDKARAVCIEHGMTLGLSEQEATMLGDAVDGVLRRAVTGTDR
ncbi:hypothetical protein [Lentzea sp. NPDC092896]|uniref:hypothetical protein n=1 Tax=Lentzea sp. NPDC092896 TaxID=3364127 RepID=UPI00382FD544